MPMTWNTEADARLLVAIISTTININWDAASAFMGPDCSVSALKHRVARLKEKAGLPATPRSKGQKTSPKRATPMKTSKADLDKVKIKKVKTDQKSKVSTAIEDDKLDQLDDDSEKEQEIKEEIKEEFLEDDDLLQYA